MFERKEALVSPEMCMYHILSGTRSLASVQQEFIAFIETDFVLFMHLVVKILLHHFLHPTLGSFMNLPDR